MTKTRRLRIILFVSGLCLLLGTALDSQIGNYGLLITFPASLVLGWNMGNVKYKDD